MNELEEQLEVLKKRFLIGGAVVLIVVLLGVCFLSQEKSLLVTRLWGASFGVLFSLANFSLWSSLYSLFAGKRPNRPLLPFLKSPPSPFLLGAVLVSLKTSLFLLLIVQLSALKGVFAVPFLVSCSGCLSVVAWSMWALKRQ